MRQKHSHSGIRICRTTKRWSLSSLESIGLVVPERYDWLNSTVDCYLLRGCGATTWHGLMSLTHPHTQVNKPAARAQFEFNHGWDSWKNVSRFNLFMLSFFYFLVGNHRVSSKSSLLWPPYVIGQAIIFCPVVSMFLLSFYLFSSPNLSGRRYDVYHTSTHGVALVRI